MRVPSGRTAFYGRFSVASGRKKALRATSLTQLNPACEKVSSVPLCRNL